MSGSPLAARLQEIMREGKLAPHDVIIGLLKRAIGDSKSDVVLVDGFPRSLEQVRQVSYHPDLLFETGSAQLHCLLSSATCYLRPAQDALRRLSLCALPPFRSHHGATQCPPPDVDCTLNVGACRHRRKRRTGNWGRRRRCCTSTAPRTQCGCGSQECSGLHLSSNIRALCVWGCVHTVTDQTVLAPQPIAQCNPTSVVYQQRRVSGKCLYLC